MSNFSFYKMSTLDTEKRMDKPPDTTAWLLRRFCPSCVSVWHVTPCQSDRSPTRHSVSVWQISDTSLRVSL